MGNKNVFYIGGYKAGAITYTKYYKNQAEFDKNEEGGELINLLNVATNVIKQVGNDQIKLNVSQGNLNNAWVYVDGISSDYLQIPNPGKLAQLSGNELKQDYILLADFDLSKIGLDAFNSSVTEDNNNDRVMDQFKSSVITKDSTSPFLLIQ